MHYTSHKHRHNYNVWTIVMVLSHFAGCSSQSLPLRALFRLLSHSSILVLSEYTHYYPCIRLWLLFSISSTVYGNVVCFSALTYFDPTFEPFLIEEVS